jgi:hypothetical protein
MWALQGSGDATTIMKQIRLEKCRTEITELGLAARKKQVRWGGRSFSLSRLPPVACGVRCLVALFPCW